MPIYFVCLALYYSYFDVCGCDYYQYDDYCCQFVVSIATVTKVQFSPVKYEMTWRCCEIVYYYCDDGDLGLVKQSLGFASGVLSHNFNCFHLYSVAELALCCYECMSSMF